MARLDCLVCLISTVSGLNKKAKNLVLVVGTQQNLSTLFLQISMDPYHSNQNNDLISTSNQNDSTRLKNISVALSSILFACFNQSKKSAWQTWQIYKIIICLQPLVDFLTSQTFFKLIESMKKSSNVSKMGRCCELASFDKQDPLYLDLYFLSKSQDKLRLSLS